MVSNVRTMFSSVISVFEMSFPMINNTTNHRPSSHQPVARRAAGLWAILFVWAACLIGTPNLQAADHAEKSSATADDHHDGHGEYSIKKDLNFWSLIAFIGFAFAIKKLGLWDSLLTNMSARQTSESAAIETAESTLNISLESLRAAKGRVEALDQKIREIRDEAGRDAQSTRNEIQATAAREAQSALDRANLEIGRTRDQALNEIFETVADQVTARTEQKLRQNLQADDQNRLLDEALAGLSI
ncbi:hypothetical protein SH668x_003564 [Planctomicrobium sp. SH668]|uniref:F0F1 ATP synthase subunit B family protein n=1 Tax=Planctomicrobium sp. SH668 TaxID=3448126 RepID=UPI003F5C58A5